MGKKVQEFVRVADDYLVTHLPCVKGLRREAVLKGKKQSSSLDTFEAPLA